MRRRYKQLSLEDREWIFAYKRQGLSNREIAKKLGRSHTTIGRELRRNAPYFQEYVPARAHKRAVRRGALQRRKAPLKEPFIYLYVREHLRAKYTPEAIAGKLPLDHPGKSIHHETIYRYIYSHDTKREKLWKHLKRHRKKRMERHGRKVRKEKITGTSIDLRPKRINSRKEFGHWETDLMEGKHGEPVASVQVERKTRYMVIGLLPDKTALSKAMDMVSRFGMLPEGAVKSITADRGSENAYHRVWTDGTGADVYLCNPYHSWEKGTVENSIGRIRFWLPKKYGLAGVTQEVLNEVARRENNTPRKCLGWLTPREKMEQELKRLRNH